MKIDVTRTEVIVGNGYIVNKGEYKINSCEFTFSEEYTAELVKKAVFDDGKTEKEMAIINNKCDIPYEVLDSDSFVLRVYAYQVVNEELELVYSPTPATVYLREGSYRGVTGLGEVITATQFEQYEQALNDGLNELEEGLNEVANVDIDVSKTGTTATVTITNREGTEKSVEILDGTDYVLTQEDKQEIIDIVEAEVSLDIPTKNSQLENDSGFITKEVNNLTNYTLKTSTGSSIELSINSSTYVMTLNLKNASGTVISTGTIDLPLETMVVGATYDNTNKKIVLTLKNGSTIDVPVGDLVSGLQSEITSSNKLSSDLVDDTNHTNKFVTASEKEQITTNATDISNIKDGTSIDSFGDVETALSGKEDSSNKTGVLNSSSTTAQYPHAKAVYDELVERDEEINQLWNDHPDILDDNALPSGTDLTLNGTGDLKMKVDVGGNSTQETTSTSEGDEYDSPSPEHKQDINNVEGNVVVKGKNRNIFDEDIFLNASGWTKNNGVYSGANNNLEVYASNGFPNLTFKENTQYTYKFKAYQSENGNSRFIFKYADGTSSTVLITATGDFSEYNLTSDINKTVEKLSFSYGSGNKTLYIKEFQLVKGTTTKDYVPHAENTVTFPLSQGQKLMLGDTLEDDGIHHKRGQIVLNGTESISINTNYTTNDLLVAQFPETLFNNVISGTNQCLCSHFKYYSSSTIKNTFRFAGKFLLCTLDRSEYSTVEDFKTYLAEQYANGTPVIIEYELETETTETYTQAQQTAYNKLKEMQSYYDLTYVVGSSDNAHPILTVQAKKSLKVINDEISNINSRLTLLEE